MEAKPLPIGATTSMLVAAELRQRILEGDLKPGQQIRIEEIAALCGVSHMPVRTALQELEAEGTVILHPRRVAEIRRIDALYITHMLDVRGAVEAMLTGQCAQLIQSEDLVRLTRYVEAFEDEAQAGPGPGLVKLNFQIHSFINGIANNHEALRVLGHGRLLIEALRRRSGYGGDRISEIIHDHRMILDAVTSRDPAAARAAAQRHCDFAREELLRLLS